MNFEDDLRTRWTPSAEQDAAALAKLRAEGADTVVSAHLLIGKEHGWWGEGIVVEPIPGLFVDRNDASDALQKAGRERHEQTGKPVSGAYVYHRLPRQGDPAPVTADGTVWQTAWSVFEDILCTFPIPEWKRRRTRDLAEG